MSRVICAFTNEAIDPCTPAAAGAPTEATRISGRPPEWAMTTRDWSVGDQLGDCPVPAPEAASVAPSLRSATRSSPEPSAWVTE